MATNPFDKVYLSKTNLENIAGGGSVISGDDTYNADEDTLYLVPDDSDIPLSNLGTITTTTIVADTFYRNNIAVSGGVSVGDIVFVQMSNGAVYPAINNNATQLVIFNGTSFTASSLIVTKAWKINTNA